MPTIKTRQSLGVSSSSRHRQAVDADGIPVVRATRPGDEVEDFKKLKAEQLARLKAVSSDQSQSASTPVEGRTTGTPPASSTAPSGSESNQAKSLQHARRFHLTRSLSSFYKPNLSGGIRKPSTRIRPPLATFIERQKHLQSASLDKLNQNGKQLVEPNDLKPKAVESSSYGAGTTISDHPSTWDTNSDRLADQLAALAMELEPPQETTFKQPVALQSTTQATASLDEDVADETDFVLETYVRVPREGFLGLDQTSTMPMDSIGVLVIDEEDEDLWRAYMDEDGESEWDEEDSNGKPRLRPSACLQALTSPAEDNPANDYPEDEVSSEDEFDRGAYNYRHHNSDDEQYDDDDSESDMY